MRVGAFMRMLCRMGRRQATVLAAHTAVFYNAAFVLNNASRTEVPRFERECGRHGLEAVLLPSLSAGDGVLSTFLPPWDDDDTYTFFEVTWTTNGS